MNVFQFSQTAEANWKANLQQMTDWQPKYTFYSDFGIAEFCEVYGGDKGAILDTYKRVIEGWKGSYKALTEVILVLNHKIWAYYPKSENVAGVDGKLLGISSAMSDKIARLYNDLWEKAKKLFFELYEGNEEAVSYYYRVTD